MSKLLAPNGKPSNLTPEQYKLVRSSNFKKWFGDWENEPENASKVVNNYTGEPLVLYHATTEKGLNNFHIFSQFKGQLNFTDDKGDAEAFWEEWRNENRENDVRIIPVFLNVKKIFNVWKLNEQDIENLKDLMITQKELMKKWYFRDFDGGNDNKYDKTDIRYLIDFLIHYGESFNLIEEDFFQNMLKEKKYDGFTAQESSFERINYGVYLPNQIKLADGTNTTFDGSNPDIRFDEGGEIEKYEIGGIYQGTPHDFDKYSTEYIGTGEGLQAFGWGLYFTDIKDIAKNYAKNELLIQKEISRKSDNSAHLWIYTNISDNVVDKLGYLKIKLKEFEELKNEYKKDTWEREIETYSTLIDIIKNYQGKIYSVTLFKGEKESDYDLIQWEKPLGVDDLIKIFDEAEKIDGIDFKDGWELDEKYGLTNQKGNKVTGEEMYRWLSKKLDGDKEASLFLLRAGIDGIKYKAGTLSSFDDLDGYNYVIFDADDVTVESKEKFKKGGEVNTGLFSQIWEWFGIKF